MFNYNFHTHTSYCDGSSSPEAYIKAALSSGLRSIGFSGHAPIPLENGFAIKNEACLAGYCNDILRLREEYKGRIGIFLGLEADYIPGITIAFDYFRKRWPLDYIIGSVHLVKNPEGKLWFIDGPERELWTNGLKIGYKNDVKKAVGNYYRQVCEMVENEKPDVVGHIDKVKMHNHGEFFKEDDAWYVALVKGSLEVIKQAGCIVEVNTRGFYKKRSESLFPGPRVLRAMYTMNIPVTISTDAHTPEEVALLLPEAVTALKEAGYSEVYIYSGNGWGNVPLK